MCIVSGLYYGYKQITYICGIVYHCLIAIIFPNVPGSEDPYMSVLVYPVPFHKQKLGLCFCWLRAVASCETSHKAQGQL